MRATISKIHPIKKSKNGNAFIRIEFKLENGRWAKTDICPDFRNYQRWDNVLRVGNDLTGIKLKRDNEVDADSFPELFDGSIKKKWVKLDNGSMALVDDI